MQGIGARPPTVIAGPINDNDNASRREIMTKKREKKKQTSHKISQLALKQEKQKWF